MDLPVRQAQGILTAMHTLLIEHACRLGASAATVVAAADIVVDEELAARCREPRCENYGLAMSCPPHVGGPTAFRRLLEVFPEALFFVIEVPSAVLYSSDSREVFQLLHEVAAGIEQAAVTMGFAAARAFAGGSCWEIFCREHGLCSALAEAGECRYPQQARPSMSGFGIDVARLLATAGWQMTFTACQPDGTSTAMASICGLVLIRKPESGNQKPE